jgi:hypothetical protein
VFICCQSSLPHCGMFGGLPHAQRMATRFVARSMLHQTMSACGIVVVTQVLVLAHAKADAIVRKLKESDSYMRPGYLVTCDQVCFRGVVSRGKRRGQLASASLHCSLSR